MNDVLLALGPKYTVSSKESPEKALEKAMKMVGTTDFRVLAQAGWGGPVHSLIHDPRTREIWIQNSLDQGNVFVRTKAGDRNSKTPTGIFMPPRWIEFLADLWINAYNETGVKAVLPEMIFRKTLLFSGNRGGIRYLYQPAKFSAYGPGLYLRGMPPKPYSLESLVDNETLPEDAAILLKTLLQAGTPMIICGATGAGKTTLLGALLKEIQTDMYPLNLLLIERSHEIPVEHPCYRWELDSSGKLDLDHLAEKATQLGLEWFVIGECTGGEAYFAAKAFTQGVPMMTTLHADSSAKAFKRLAMLSLEYASDPKLLPIIMEELSTQGVVSVHLSLKERESGYLGAITGIDEMTGLSGTNPMVNKLWEWKRGNDERKEGLYFNPGCLSDLSEGTRYRLESSGLVFPMPTVTKNGKGKKRR